MLNALLISDLHLTDSPKDDYRWGLFPWLAKQLQTSEFPIYYLFILGDLTDAKDFHSSKIVNKLVTALVKLLEASTKLKKIYILRGNHDGVDHNCPYFQFLQHVPKILYVGTQWEETIGESKLLMLPHTRNPKTDWADTDFHRADVIFMHATVEGSVSENGMKLEGVHHGYFHGTRSGIYSGDIHVPQTVGKVHYIGAPYPIRYGDKFVGGATLIKNGKFHSNIPFDTIRRPHLQIKTLSDLKKAGLRPHDQCKIRLQLTRAEYGDWNSLKTEISSWCEENKIILTSLELAPTDAATIKYLKEEAAKTPNLLPKEILTNYCKQQKLDKVTQTVGFSLLQDLPL